MNFGQIIIIALFITIALLYALAMAKQERRFTDRLQPNFYCGFCEGVIIGGRCHRCGGEA